MTMDADYKRAIPIQYPIAQTGNVMAHLNLVFLLLLLCLVCVGPWQPTAAQPADTSTVSLALPLTSEQVVAAKTEPAEAADMKQVISPPREPANSSRGWSRKQVGKTASRCVVSIPFRSTTQSDETSSRSERRLVRSDEWVFDAYTCKRLSCVQVFEQDPDWLHP
jgi:hypothetical protein